MNATSLITFLRTVGRLKRVKRTGWVEAGIPDPESVADHTYRVAILAMVLADNRALNTSKAIRMALIHDLAEAIIGDLTPDQKLPSQAEAETKAFNTVTGSLDVEQREYYRELFNEYQVGETPEAALVHVADKLDLVLQALEYEEEGVETSMLDDFWDVDLLEDYKPLLLILKKLRTG